MPPVLSLLQRHSAERPDACCLFSIDQDRRLTWRELLQEVQAWAKVFDEAGVRLGDRIAIVGENSLELATLYCAVLAYGAVFCPISSTLPPEEIDRVLARLRPRLVWREQTSRLEALAAASSASAGAGHAAICFTSGTTDGAKAVAHTFESYYQNALQTLARWGLTTADRVLDYRSFTWAATHTVSLHPLVVGGHSLVFARGFRAAELAGWVRRHRPTVLVGIPLVIDAMIEQADTLDPADFASLRFVSCSTAPLTSERHRRFEEHFRVPLVQLYGMSEGGLIALNPHDRRRIGSVGLPSSVQDLRIVSPTGAELPQGEVGEIVVGGPACAAHYVLEDGTLAPITRTVLPTGDMGRIDEDGYLSVLGRTAQAFLRNGRQILPFLIDQSLIAAGPVKDAASVGRDGRITSFVVRSGEMDAAAVMAHCSRTLSADYLPDEIVFCDEIPRNARGKVDFEKLRRA
jgi:acyl-coenzyme A synthetase/AMP-(fatty) acid ligase